MTSWVNSVVWWQVYPLGFVGAEKQPVPRGGEVHRLSQLLGWLDHLISLGANGLLLGPIFTSSSHGYDTVDYFQIDPRLGDDSDFDALVTACRSRGVRLLLDGVFNHAGRDFPPVAEALRRRSRIRGRALGVPAVRHRRRDHGRLLRRPRHPGHAQSRLSPGS